MSEPLPSERCPHCGLSVKPLLWSVDTIHDLRRGYRCPNCRREWSVEGQQQTLFSDDDKEASPYRLTRA